MSKDDLRFRKTEKAIKNAFLELLKTYPLEEITIKQIATLAECNRNTFYLHYEDKYNLLKTLCADELAQLEKELSTLPFLANISDGNWYLDCARQRLKAVEANWDFYLPILGQGKEPAFANSFGKFIPRYIRSILEKKEIRTQYSDFTLEFLSAGMIGVIRCWLLEPEKYTKKQIIQEFESLVTVLGNAVFK